MDNVGKIKKIFYEINPIRFDGFKKNVAIPSSKTVIHQIIHNDICMKLNKSKYQVIFVHKYCN